MNGNVEALAFSADGDKLFSHGGMYVTCADLFTWNMEAINRV